VPLENLEDARQVSAWAARQSPSSVEDQKRIETFDPKTPNVLNRSILELLERLHHFDPFPNLNGLNVLNNLN
jgi:hypothetical protein